MRKKTGSVSLHRQFGAQPDGRGAGQPFAERPLASPFGCHGTCWLRASTGHPGGGGTGHRHLGPASKSVQEFREITFDLVITLCDDAAKTCPAWLGSGERVHLGLPDPAQATGTQEERLAGFRQVRDSLYQELLGYLTSWEGQDSAPDDEEM